jgi:hypothetical protein
MKTFRFPLERVLAWRHAQLDREEQLLKQLRGSLAALENAGRELALALTRAAAGLPGLAPLDARDCFAMAGYQAHVRGQQQVLRARRRDCERRIEEQQERWLELRRQVRLLERLKERRLAEWQAGADREIEELAGESYLAKWNRP